LVEKLKKHLLWHLSHRLWCPRVWKKIYRYYQNERPGSWLKPLRVIRERRVSNMPAPWIKRRRALNANEDTARAAAAEKAKADAAAKAKAAKVAAATKAAADKAAADKAAADKAAAGKAATKKKSPRKKSDVGS
jgi:hypothetical protein